MCVHVRAENALREFPEIFNICIYSSTVPKFLHLFRFVTAKTHGGGNLARHGAALATTVTYHAQHDECGPKGKRCTNNNIVSHQLRSDHLQSNIRWFLAQLNHQVCGVKPPQTDCLRVPGSQGTPSSGTTEQMCSRAAKFFCFSHLLEDDP